MDGRAICEWLLAQRASSARRSRKLAYLGNVTGICQCPIAIYDSGAALDSYATSRKDIHAPPVHDIPVRSVFSPALGDDGGDTAMAGISERDPLSVDGSYSATVRRSRKLPARLSTGVSQRRLFFNEFTILTRSIFMRIKTEDQGRLTS